MWIKNLDPKSKIISVAIPLTKATGKIRIKKRNNFNEYGIPVPTKAEAFSPQCYVEWQIGYDVAVKEEEKLKLTTIKDCCFIGANGKEKTLYELSEYIFYFYQWKVIPQKALLQIKEFLENLKEEDFIENSEVKTNPKQDEIFYILNSAKEDELKIYLDILKPLKKNLEKKLHK